MKRLAVPALVALAASCAWSWRPPTPLGGRPTAYAVPPSDVAAARAAADSLFQVRGAPVDTLELTGTHELRVVLPAGTYARRPRFEGATCVPGEVAWDSLRPLAVLAYRTYGRRRGAERVTVVVRGDSAVTGGWFRRQMCGTGPATAHFQRPELDSVLGAA
jgi:hypothetical protein